MGAFLCRAAGSWRFPQISYHPPTPQKNTDKQYELKACTDQYLGMMYGKAAPLHHISPTTLACTVNPLGTEVVTVVVAFPVH